MRISLCIIARDEAENLAALLEQMRGIVDECVVIDTGSRDNQTLEVARRFGARTGHHEWCDSFAAARNAALELATGDWILSLDADERLIEASPGALRALLEEAEQQPRPPDVYVCYCPLIRTSEELEHGITNVAVTPRIFPRHPRIRWVQPLFERPALLAPPGSLSSVVVPQLVVVHLGHPEDAARQAEKRARNARIIRAELERNPEEPFAWAVAGHEHLLAGDYAAAARDLERAITLAGARPPAAMEQAYIDLVQALRHVGDYDRAIQYGLEGLHHFPTAELDCAVALAYMLRGRPNDDDQALIHYRRARSLYYLRSNIIPGDQDAMTWKPLWGMGLIYQRRGEWGQALSCFQEALQYAPSHAALHQHAAQALRQLGHPAEAAAHLRQAMAQSAATKQPCEQQPDQEIVLALVDSLVEAGELQEAYDHLDGLVRRWPANMAFRLRLADLLIEAKEYAAAADVLAGALSGTTLAPALIYQRLGEACLHLGRLEDAARAFEIALELNPEDQASSLGLRAVQKLKASSPGR